MSTIWEKHLIVVLDIVAVIKSLDISIYYICKLLFNFDSLVQTNIVQTFQTTIIIYRRIHFVYYYWGCISIYSPLSYPLRSLLTYNINKIKIKGNSPFRDIVLYGAIFRILKWVFIGYFRLG